MKLKIVKDETSFIVFKILKNELASGKEISKKLGISRTAVWKAVEKLKYAGYTIEGKRGLGYRLISNPEFSVYEVAEICFSNGFEEFYFFDIVDSTNTFLKNLLSKREVKAVAIALRQTSGRGRFGRKWISEKGGLYMSLCFPLNYIKADVSDISAITLTSGVAVCKAISEITPASIKWPNDILINGKKVCGILCELCGETENPWIVIGIGVNVKNELPKDVNATNLINYGVDIDEVCKLILLRLFEYLKKDWKYIRKEWLELAKPMIGKYIKVKTPNKIYTGIVKGIDDRGALILEKDGKEVPILSGDCLLVRG